MDISRRSRTRWRSAGWPSRRPRSPGPSRCPARPPSRWPCSRAAGAGIAVGALTDFGAKGALLGLAAGGAALIGLRVASYDYPSRFVHMTAGVALPLTVAAPVVYLVGRAVL